MAAIAFPPSPSPGDIFMGRWQWDGDKWMPSGWNSIWELAGDAPADDTYGRTNGSWVPAVGVDVGGDAEIDGTLKAASVETSGNIRVSGTVYADGPSTSNGYLLSYANLAAAGATSPNWGYITRGHQGMSIHGYTGPNNVVNIYRTNPAWAECSHQAMHVPANWAGYRWNVSGDWFDFRNGTRAVKNQGTGWEIESDARIKNITGDYTHGLLELMRLKPVTFAYRRERTAPSFPNDKTEYVGLTTQNVEEAGLGEFVTKEQGEIEGLTVSDFGYLEPDGLIFTLINAVKELSSQVEKLTERVASLEAR